MVICKCFWRFVQPYIFFPSPIVKWEWNIEIVTDCSSKTVMAVAVATKLNGGNTDKSQTNDFHFFVSSFLNRICNYQYTVHYVLLVFVIVFALQHSLSVHILSVYVRIWSDTRCYYYYYYHKIYHISRTVTHWLTCIFIFGLFFSCFRRTVWLLLWLMRFILPYLICLTLFFFLQKMDVST